MQKFFRVLFYFFVFGVAKLYAGTFTWLPLAQEPSFSVDIPDSWLRNYEQQKNAAQVYFFLKQSSMELRSEQHEKVLSLPLRVSQVAARLAVRYDYLSLHSEGAVSFRDDVHRVVWSGERNKEKFVVQVFFLQKENSTLTLICQSSAQEYNQRKVFFDNAAYSFQIIPTPVQEAKPISEPNEKNINERNMRFLRDFVQYNSANAKPDMLGKEKKSKTPIKKETEKPRKQVSKENKKPKAVPKKAPSMNEKK